MRRPTRVLFAWELGANLGHLAPMGPLATRLRTLGHTVEAVVRDPSVGRSVFGEGCRPLPTGPSARTLLDAKSWPELLRSAGWSRPEELAPRVAAWRSLLDELAPDVVIADSAPTLMLAARGRDVRAISFSNGYSQPPLTRPFPAMRWWRDPPSDLEAREQRLVDVVRAAGEPTIHSFADLFAPWTRLVQGTPRTDAYGPVRSPGDAAFVGPSAALGYGTEPEWPSVPGPRVFAYVNGAHRAVPAVLQALTRAGAAVLAYAPGLPDVVEAALPTVSFAPGPVHLGRVRQEAAAAVCHSASGTGAAFLDEGVPVLLLPCHLEQEMSARAAVPFGGAHLVSNGSGALERAVATLLAPEARTTARAAPWTGESVVDTVARLVGSVR